MPDTNLIAQIADRHRVAWLDDQPVAEPEPNELLIRSRYTLISPGTELAMFNKTHIGFSEEGNSFAKYPFLPGYCAAGEVVEVGSEVRRFEPGDLVYHSGRHARFMRMNPSTQIVCPLPPNIDLRFAPYAHMAQIAATASALCRAPAGADACVVGLGLVGNLAAQILRLRGARVFGIDPVRERCQVARSCGLAAVAATADQAGEALRDCFGTDGADIVVEATGHPAVVAPSLQLTRPKGEAMLLGSTRGKVELDVYNLIHRPGIVVRGAHMVTLPLDNDGSGLPSRRFLIREMLGHIAAGRLEIAPLLTEVIEPRQLQSAYERLNNQPQSTFSIVLDWTG